MDHERHRSRYTVDTRLRPCARRHRMQSVDSSVRDLVESLDVEQILPPDYAAYGPLVLDGLCFFLNHLPKRRVAEIVSKQLALPPGTGFERRVVNLLHQCPTLHKLGQIVSRDRRLSHGLRRCLQDLESMRPQTKLDDISQEIGNALRNREGIELSPRPLAEASVAIILPFTWRDGRSSQIRQGVFKVLRPGVEERLYEELEIWAELGVFLEGRCEYHGLPLLDYRETLNTVRRLLKEEVRFDREQQHLAEAATFYEDEPDIVIPRLYDRLVAGDPSGPFPRVRMVAAVAGSRCRLDRHGIPGEPGAVSQGPSDTLLGGSRHIRQRLGRPHHAQRRPAEIFQRATTSPPRRAGLEILRHSRLQCRPVGAVGLMAERSRQLLAWCLARLPGAVS